MKKVIIANDHGALDLKALIMEHLTKRGYTIEDCGVNTTDSMDYPDKAEEACHRFMEEGDYEFGIVLCTTGIGISISANKTKGIRCALPQNAWAAEMTKRHNNSNFIAFGGSPKITYPEPVTDILDAYIDAEYEGGRHQRRIDKMMKIEEK
ncbi:MAG: RpiB/LacA/LacB family sugar-phosphate isomerase [Spirochaetales bacterium]|nr:RpiB/LacA/LacB family sugar-phosphate isomerase [Spirochaetales bacterium]